MKKLTLPLLTLLMFVAAAALWAADVWVAKPYTEWTDKDLQKIMSDSPWAKKVSVTFENVGRGGGAAAAGGGSGKGGGRGGPQGDSIDPGADSVGAGGGGGRGGGGGGRGGGGGDAGGGGGGAQEAPETELVVRWQTAPTIMQAWVKSRFGTEVATNPDAQKALQPDEMYYVIWVAGLPQAVRPRDDDAKNTLLKLTTLSAKDKDAITAVDVQFPPPPDAGAKGGRGRGFAATTDAHFLFPRKVAFTADDKEIEFATKFGKNAVKAKFTVKTMVVNGKLGL
jgi:hypothetical protein